MASEEEQEQQQQSQQGRSDNEEEPFLMDEEMEARQKAPPPRSESDIDSDVNDDDVAKLMIVMQVPRRSKPGERSRGRGLSEEVLNVINDGLYMYEKELRHNRRTSGGQRGGRGRQRPVIGEDRQQAASSSGGEGAVAAPATNGTHSASHMVVGSLGSSAGSGSEGHGPLRPPRGYPRARGGATGRGQRVFPPSNRGTHLRRTATGESPPGDSVGFFFGSTPPDVHGAMNAGSFGSALGSAPVRAMPRMGSSPALGVSPGSLALGTSPPVLSGSMPKNFPHFQHPSHALLEENGFRQQKYTKYYKRCIADRNRLGVGCSEEMNTLFRFWCYFLRTHFNRTMYDDFVKYAVEDSTAQYFYGMECLFRFFSYGLEQRFQKDLYEDFERLTLDEYKKGNIYGLEKYWAFHRYNKGAPVEKVPELATVLETEFRTMEDFKRAKNERQAKEEGLNAKGSAGSFKEGSLRNSLSKEGCLPPPKSSLGPAAGTSPAAQPSIAVS